MYSVFVQIDALEQSTYDSDLFLFWIENINFFFYNPQSLFTVSISTFLAYFFFNFFYCFGPIFTEHCITDWKVKREYVSEFGFAALSGLNANDLRNTKCQTSHANWLRTNINLFLQQENSYRLRFFCSLSRSLCVDMSFFLFVGFISRPELLWIACVLCTFAVCTLSQQSFTCVLIEQMNHSNEPSADEKRKEIYVPMKRREESNQTTKCQHSFLYYYYCNVLIPRNILSTHNIF